MVPREATISAATMLFPLINSECDVMIKRAQRDSNEAFSPHILSLFGRFIPTGSRNRCERRTWLSDML